MQQGHFLLIRYFLLNLFIGINAFVQAQAPAFVWAGGVGSLNVNTAVSGFALDSAGFRITCGTFADLADLDPTTAVKNFSSYGKEDVFIQKLDGQGNLIWAVTLGGKKRDFANDILVDKTGDVYIIGTFEDTMDLDPGVGSKIVVAHGATADAFIIKLSRLDGSFIWGHGYGGQDPEG